MSAKAEATGHVDRVLVVDDDPAARLLAREALEQAGFHVTEAEDGREALRLIELEPPDIVLLDVIMPELDGYAACTVIRSLSGGQHVPVLMMTGLDDMESIKRAYEAGATDFAAKPINYPLLPHRVRYILRGTRLADELRASEARLKDSQRIARLGHFEWHIGSGRIECSAQVNDLFGLPGGEAIDSQDALMRYIFPEDRDVLADMVQTAIKERRGYSLEHRIVRADGTVRSMYQEGEFHSPAERRGLYLSATIQDVTERRRMERQVHHLAHYDPVTGLPNRRLMKRHLSAAISHARRHHRTVAVMTLDIDHFSRINDSLGQAAGDELLKTIAGRLRDCIVDASAKPDGAHAQSSRDLVARIGGDEFVIVLAGIQSLEDAAIVARRVRDIFTRTCTVGNTDVTLTASIGISGFPLDSLDAETLLKQADTAMHHAKTLGRDRYQFSTARINSRASERLVLENNLRKALAAGQFELHYQPKVHLRGMVPVGMEALVRWSHPEMGAVPPSVFVPVAEETGLIVPLGEWILHEACRQAKAWQHAGLPPLAVSVNLSAGQFRAKGIQAVIAGVLQETGIDPAFLELELTESLLMEDRDACIKLMQKLRLLGVSLSIDDFGTGYSSLSYLKRFPINALKIDRSFVCDVGTDADVAAIVTAIIALAHSLRLKVVAEGVESEQQVRFLTEQHCDEIQGYYFSQPLSAADFGEWVRQRTHALPPLRAVNH
ncbi:MAG: putative bifunctional diguanylate cyclase/phosphodiesterase [Chromatiales bacterium]